MDSIKEYLSKTESASKILFGGIDSYLDILRETPSPVFVPGSFEEEGWKKEDEKWQCKNKEEIRVSIEAQNRFVDEFFAMSTLCSSLLQIAAMAIQKYSTNSDVPDNFAEVIKTASKPAKFCVGRLKRGIPIGLIIYAGRNQFNHLDEDKLREPNTTIFEKLSQIEDLSNKGAHYKDPAFDLNNALLASYASNIIIILGWHSYEDYSKDILGLFE
jgi:hypothetical protein